MTQPTPVQPTAVEPAVVEPAVSERTVVTFVGGFHAQMWDRFIDGMTRHLRELDVPCTVSLFTGDKAARAELFINDLAGNPPSGPSVGPVT